MSNSRTSGFAIASLVLGILGMSVLALIFGYLGLRDTKRDPTLGGRGLAIAGVVLGWIGVAATIIIVFVLSTVMVAGSLSG